MTRYIFITINLITILMLLGNCHSCHGLHRYDVGVEGDPFRPTFVISRNESSATVLIEIDSYPDRTRYWSINWSVKGDAKLIHFVYGEVPDGFNEYIKAKKLKPYILYQVTVDDGEDAVGVGFFYIKRVKNRYKLVDLGYRTADVHGSIIMKKLIALAKKLEKIRKRKKKRKGSS